MENENISYITRYQKANTTQINVRLSKKYDADIINWLNSLGDLGKATYIKKLIREDMERNGFTQAEDAG
jgi:S-adenosylmethionine:tRNA-ribosyltransferase-isomerase (queuine synthetase)